jgi:hypothetical protein
MAKTTTRTRSAELHTDKSTFKSLYSLCPLLLRYCGYCPSLRWGGRLTQNVPFVIIGSHPPPPRALSLLYLFSLLQCVPGAFARATRVRRSGWRVIGVLEKSLLRLDICEENRGRDQLVLNKVRKRAVHTSDNERQSALLCDRSRREDLERCRYS